MMTLRRIVPVAALFALAMGVIAPAHAAVEDCRSLIVSEPEFEGDDRVVEVEVAGNPVHVLLPTDYDDSGATRYPVLYLLHGFSQNHHSWLTLSDLIDLTKDDEVIVVLPAMNGLAIDVDHRNGTRLWETFFVEQLIPFVDAIFPTLADRAHRAVAGLSAVSALTFAGRHPDLFTAVGGLSSGAAFAYRSPGGEAPFASFERTVWACYGGQAGDDGALGDPATEAIWYHNISPADLAPNYRGMTVYVSIGTGTPCDCKDVRGLVFPSVPAEYGVQHWGEAFLRTTQQVFHDTLVAEGIAHTWDARPCGLHSWRYFEKGLHAFWPRMLAAFGAPPPRRFDFRTADAPNNRVTRDGSKLLSNHDVWGWSFLADPERATEFLEVTGASVEGLTLRGSGLTTVTTASYFSAGQIVALGGGAMEQIAVADAAGRITFHVFLGPAHRFQMYTPAALALEVAGRYWGNRTITFQPES